MSLLLEAIEENITSTLDSLTQFKTLIRLQIEGIERENHLLQEERERLNQDRLHLEKKEEDLKIAWLKFEKERLFVSSVNSRLDDVVDLNVGGTSMSTTRSTLCSLPGSMLEAMFSGRHSLKTDVEGRYFLDRDPHIFKYVLSFLRNQRLNLPDDKKSAKMILSEFDYFCISVQAELLKHKSKRLLTEPIINTSTLRGHESAVGCLCYFGDKIVSSANDNTIKIWYRNNSFCLKTLYGHKGDVYCVATNGQVIVSGSDDKTINVWDLETGKWINTLKGHTERIWCIEIKDNIILSGAHKHVKVWDLRTGQATATLTGHTGWVRCIKIMGDKAFTGGSKENTICIWDLKTNECKQLHTGHDGDIFCLDVADNKLVTGSRDKTIKIWDTNTGTCINTLIGHTKAVYCVSISSTVIVSGSWDNSVKVWDIETGECKATLSGHTNSVYAVKLHGDTIYTGSCDKTIKIWKVV